MGTGGMLKAMAGVSYRNLGWETGAEHQGQLPKRVCGGNPEEEKLQPQQPERNLPRLPPGAPQAVP